MMHNTKIDKSKFVPFVKLFNEIISSTVVWENDMPMFVLFAGAGCSASSGVALGGRMVQIIQKYCFLKESEKGIFILAKWKRNEETLETFIQNCENEIDEKEFNDYVERKRKQFAEKYDNIELKIELLKSLPLSFQKLIQEDKKCDDIKRLAVDELEEIWEEYKDKLLGDLEYGFWMQEYSPERDKIQELMEEFIENKTPAFEYYLLADLINQGMLYNVFTTNFDNFIHEAMSFLGTRARVCIYDDKASSISYNRKKPNIIKLHGEYLYNNTKNYINETHDLGEFLGGKFREALQRFGMIVVGYQGNDYSIMHILEELKKERPYPLYWCVRTEDLEKISWRVVELVNNTPMSYIVPIKDFRTFVIDLWNCWSQTHNEEKRSSIENVLNKAKNIQSQLTKVIREQSYIQKVPVHERGIEFNEYFNGKFEGGKSPFALGKNEGINSFNIDYDITHSYSLGNARIFISELPSYKQEVVDCIMNLLAEHIYLTTKQIYLLLYKKGYFYGDRDNLLKLIRNLKEKRILAMYQFKSAQSKMEGLFIISLDYVGAKMYKAKQKKNANWNLSTVINTSVYDMKRILAANQLITEVGKWADILFLIRPKLSWKKDVANALRPTVQIEFSLNDEEYFGMVECVRDFTGWKNELDKKLKRYDSFLLNYGGYKNLILILCGEDAEHVKEIYLVLDDYLQTELNKYRQSKLNYINVWFTFDRILLNKRLEYSFFRLYTQNDQIYATNIDVSAFVTHDYSEVLPVQEFIDKENSIEKREKIETLLKEFLKELETSYRLIRYGRLGDFSNFLNQNGVTIQEFGYTKIYDLLEHINNYYYHVFTIKGEDDNSLECITVTEKAKIFKESPFLEGICRDEDRKSKLQDVMSLVYQKSQKDNLKVCNLKQLLCDREDGGEVLEEIEQYLHDLPMIFHTFIIENEEYVRLTLDMNEDKENMEEDKKSIEETFLDILKSLMVNIRKGDKLFYLTELGQYIHKAGVSIEKYGFEKLETAVRSCGNYFDIYQLNETIEVIQLHQSYTDILLPYEIVRSRDKVENTNSECLVLQIYRNNYLSQYLEGIQNNKNVKISNKEIKDEPKKDLKKKRISNVKQLLNVMIEIIYKYDPKNKRIKQEKMEQLLKEKNIEIEDMGFEDLRQFTKLVHNTIYCYSYRNVDFIKINM